MEVVVVTVLSCCLLAAGGGMFHAYICLYTYLHTYMLKFVYIQGDSKVMICFHQATIFFNKGANLNLEVFLGS